MLHDAARTRPRASRSDEPDTGAVPLSAQRADGGPEGASGEDAGGDEPDVCGVQRRSAREGTQGGRPFRQCGGSAEADCADSWRIQGRRRHDEIQVRQDSVHARAGQEDAAQHSAHESDHAGVRVATSGGRDADQSLAEEPEVGGDRRDALVHGCGGGRTGDVAEAGPVGVRRQGGGHSVRHVISDVRERDHAGGEGVRDREAQGVHRRHHGARVESDRGC